MSEDTIKCPKCGISISKDIDECPVCGENLGGIGKTSEKDMDGEEEKILNALTQISGVGGYKAENIVKSGISDVKKLEDADLESFLSVEGIGKATAEDIVDVIEDSTKKDGSLYLCGECGAFVSADADSCPSCGTKMEDEVEEETGSEMETEVETEVEEEDEGSLYLCDNCGSFISESAEECPYCGYTLEIEDEVDEEIEEVEPEIEDEIEPDLEEDLKEDMEEESEDGLFLCTNCGSFAGAEADICPSCGMAFDEDEVEEDVEREGEIEEEIGELDVDEEVDVEEELEEEGYGEEVVEEELDVEEELEEEGYGEEVVEEELDVEEELEEVPEKPSGFFEEYEEGPEEDVEVPPDEEPGINIDDLVEYETEDSAEEITEMELDWVEDELGVEVDKSDLDELDNEISEALQEEYGVSTATLVGLSMDNDVKMCSNCGRLCEKDLSECPTCGAVFEDIDIEMAERDTEWEKDQNQKTMEKALGLTNVPDEVDEGEGDTELDICTVCGAFLTDDTDRCGICGSVVSETPDIEVDEDEVYEVHRDDDSLYICDACGALVDEYQDRCPICGSVLELSRRSVEEEHLDEGVDENKNVIEEFFGDTDGIELEKKIENEEVDFCDVCGGLLSEGAKNCPICGKSIVEEEKEVEETDIEEERVESELEDLMVMEKEETREDEQVFSEMEQLEGEIDDLILDDEDIELDTTSDEELIDLLSSLSEGENIEEINRGIGESEGESEGESIEETEEIDEGEIYGEQENIEEEVVQETIEADDHTEDVEEEMDVTEALEDIGSMVTEKGSEEDEWVKCPSCDSYVSVESDVCGVCDHDLTRETDVEEETTSYEYEDVGVNISELKEYKDRKSKDSWESREQGEDIKDRPSSVPSTPSYSPQSKFKGVMTKIKEYEVPISSLSLFAFGGVYLTTYGDSNLRYFTDVGLILLGIFFGMGLFTLFIMREDLRESFYGVLGYFGAIGIASFVPINEIALRMDMPLLLNVGLIVVSLGMFWMLDYKLPRDYRYYLIWFSGISLIMAVLILVKLDAGNGLFAMSYPVLMTLGLGGILIASGTSTWYNRASGEEDYYGEIEKGHKHLIKGDYLDAVKSFDKSIERGDKTKINVMSEEENPAFPYYSKGLALCNMGEYEKAVKTFKEVLEINPKSVPTWNNLGTAFSRMGDQKKAVKCLKKALKIDPEYEISWNNMGNAMFRMDNYEGALECYDEALDINSSYRDASLNKTQCLTKLSAKEMA